MLTYVTEEISGNSVVGYDATVVNTGTADRQITSLRYAFAFSSQSGGTDAPEAITVSGGGISPTTLVIGDRAKPVASTTLGQDESLTLEIDSADAGRNFDSFIVLTALVNVGGGATEEQALYFIDGSIKSLTADLEISKSGDVYTFDASDSTPQFAIDEYQWDFDNDGRADRTTTTSTTTLDCGGNRPPRICSSITAGGTATVTVVDTDPQPDRTASDSATYP